MRVAVLLGSREVSGQRSDVIRFEPPPCLAGTLGLAARARARLRSTAPQKQRGLSVPLPHPVLLEAFRASKVTPPFTALA